MSNLIKFICWVWAILASVTLGGAKTEDTINVPANLDEISEQVRTSTQDVEWTPGIDEWQAPAAMVKELRYYVGSYDYSKRPVMYWEAGRWDVKKYVTNPATKDDYYKYTEQFWYRLQNLTSPFDDADEGVVLVMDMAEFHPSQLASIETIKLHMWSWRYGEKFENFIVDYILINLNFVGQTWIQIIRPIAGKLIGKSETFGGQPSRWLPVLASKVPKGQIPTWYGGSGADYKPIKVWNCEIEIWRFQ